MRAYDFFTFNHFNQLKNLVFLFLNLHSIFLIGCTHHQYDESSQWMKATNCDCMMYNTYPLPGGVKESATWSGPCVKGKIDGFGTVVWYKNNNFQEKVVGNFVKGRANGKATVYYPNGNIVHAYFKNGLRIKDSDIPEQLSNSLSTDDFTSKAMQRIDGNIPNNKKYIIKNAQNSRPFRAYWAYLSAYILEESLKVKGLNGSIFGIPINMKGRLIEAEEKLRLQYDIPINKIPIPDQMEEVELNPPIEYSIERYIQNR